MNFLDGLTTTHKLDQSKIMSSIYVILILELIILLYKYTGNSQLEMNYEVCSAFSTPSDTKDKGTTESRKHEHNCLEAYHTHSNACEKLRPFSIQRMITANMVKV